MPAAHIKTDIQYTDSIGERFQIPCDIERHLGHALQMAYADMQTQMPASVELTVRICDVAEMQQLNQQYRHKNRPTNILSFPSDLPAFIESDYIGDLLICAEVLEKEAREQNKSLEDHWAHILVHGFLHLLGYDHIQEDDAEKMEGLEIAILQRSGIANPYQAQ